MNKYITSSFITILGLYVVFVGLMGIAAILDWTTWDIVTEWSVKIGASALVVFLINCVIALLTKFLPKK